jgi:signal transduction histidine kinase
VDAAIAVGCIVTALAIQLSGVEAVSANRPVGPLSLLLTLAAVAPLAVRRRFPLAVLASTASAVLALIATRSVVGLAPIGLTIAFYTAVAWAPRRQARVAEPLLIGVVLVAGLLRPVDLSAEGALVNGTLLVVAWVLGTGTRRRRDQFRAEVVAAEHRADLEHRRAEVESERAARAAADERLRISRELHDVIGHAMAVMVVQAGVAEQLLDSNPDQARQAIGEIAATGRGSLTEMRRLLAVLRDGDLGDDAGPSPLTPTPGLAQVPALAATVQAAGPTVEVRVTGELDGLPPGLDLAAYRVVQEALTNALKHGRPSAIVVAVTRTGQHLDVTVDDNGTGQGDGPGTGHGIAGMRERVAIYRGELSAGPAASGGFRVRAWFPLTARTSDTTSPGTVPVPVSTAGRSPSVGAS